MTAPPPVRCAIYTRKSTEEGLDQAFNSLDAQREACEAYIASQRHEGWQCLTTRYDDGGHSGGTMDRPSLKELLADVAAGKVDVVVLYKIDRLTRALSDFARIVDVLDRASASFVSVTQAFNTTTSMGRLTLNVLLSFAQFEREVGAERVRDKIAASKKKGMWMGGVCPLGFDVQDRRLVVNEAEAKSVRTIFALYLELGSVIRLERELRRRGIVSKARRSKSGVEIGGNSFSRGALYVLLRNVLYVGQVRHRGDAYEGEQPAIVDRELFERAQKLLNYNQVVRTGLTGIRADAWLTGLLWDEQGRRMSPSHTTKGPKRYRYYHSRLEPGEEDLGPAVRVPAEEIEGLVSTELLSILADPRQLHDHFAEVGAGILSEVIAAGAAGAKELATGAFEERAGLARALVRRVEVRSSSIHVQGSLLPLVPALDHDICFERDIPAIIARRTNEVRLIVPPGRQGQVGQDAGLIKLLVRAHQVRVAFEKCGRESLSGLASRLGYNLDYLSVLLKLSYLSPSLQLDILAGRQPAQLTRQFLARVRAVPLLWTQQSELANYRNSV